MSAFEVNFDGLIGPTHNYGGLAAGNLASHKNAHAISYPKKAALQGLEKMRTLVKLGYKQGFIPPQIRPDIQVLRQLGFSGTDAQVLSSVAKAAPELLPMVYSASSMWAANAATVTASADSMDGKVHFTPANLLTTAHRAIEHTQTYQLLKTIFADENYFKVHKALPSIHRFADEGAANHTRLCTHYAAQGVGLFVYGRKESMELSHMHFPARQTLEACQALARQHKLLDDRTIYLQQNPEAINAGAFHNDVVAVGNGNVLFYHQDAYVEDSWLRAYEQLQALVGFTAIAVPRAKVSFEDAVNSYLFNSQLLASPDGDMGQMRLIAPMECKENPAVYAYLEELVQDSTQPIREVVYVDVRQSMSNGGGPACLRLRVVLNEKELVSVNSAFLLDERKIDQLQGWVNDHYRERLTPQDLADPKLAEESVTALTVLEHMLDVQGIYKGHI